MMDARELSVTMSQLKGAPLAILCVLFGVGRPLGRNELIQLTTYSAGSVTAGLERLEFLGLVAHSTRYGGWLPTAVARQLPFAMPPAEPTNDAEAIEADAAEADNEVQNMYLDSSSSLSSLSGSVSLSDSETTPPEGEVQKMNLADPADRNPAPDQDVDVEEAVGLLIEAGCPERTTKRNGARDAVEAALARGWTGGEVLEAVDGWLAYADTPAGKWINHRGFLAGKRIAAGIAPPELSREEESRRYLAQVWAERGLS